MSITNEFYNKFPSFNSNSKEYKRNEQIVRYQAELLKKAREDIKFKQSQNNKKKNYYARKTTDISNNNNSKNIGLFSSEERNLKEAKAIAEKKRNFRKVLLEQIEEEKLKKEFWKNEEVRKEKLLEEKFHQQLENEKNASIYERPVEKERIFFSGDDEKKNKINNYNNNNVYRYFSKSSSELYNYRKNNVADLASYSDALLKEFLNYRIVKAKCRNCHKQFDMICNDCNYVKKSKKDDDDDEWQLEDIIGSESKCVIITGFARKALEKGS